MNRQQKQIPDHLRQRMMRGSATAIDEIRDRMLAEGGVDQVGIIIQIARQHRDVGAGFDGQPQVGGAGGRCLARVHHDHSRTAVACLP